MAMTGVMAEEAGKWFWERSGFFNARRVRSTSTSANANALNAGSYELYAAAADIPHYKWRTHGAGFSE
jgi:hypothetical protein